MRGSPVLVIRPNHDCRVGSIVGFPKTRQVLFAADVANAIAAQRQHSDFGIALALRRIIRTWMGTRRNAPRLNFSKHGRDVLSRALRGAELLVRADHFTEQRIVQHQISAYVFYSLHPWSAVHIRNILDVEDVIVSEPVLLVRIQQPSTKRRSEIGRGGGWLNVRYGRSIFCARDR